MREILEKALERRADRRRRGRDAAPLARPARGRARRQRAAGRARRIRDGSRSSSTGTSTTRTSASPTATSARSTGSRATGPRAICCRSRSSSRRSRRRLRSAAPGVLMQGGHHPDLGIEYYEDLFRSIKERYKIHLHALSPPEVQHISRRSKLDIPQTLTRLRDAGLDSTAGRRRRGARRPGARHHRAEEDEEQRVDRRDAPCPAARHVDDGHDDVRPRRDGRGARRAHAPDPRAAGRDCTAFARSPRGRTRTTATGSARSSRRETMPTSFDYLLTQAVSRIYLDNVDHIQSSWVTQGMKIGQVALEFGADDLGSIMIEENVVSAAGTTYRASTDDFVRTIKSLGKIPVQRDTLYREVRVSRIEAVSASARSRGARCRGLRHCPLLGGASLAPAKPLAASATAPTPAGPVPSCSHPVPAGNGSRRRSLWQRATPPTARRCRRCSVLRGRRTARPTGVVPGTVPLHVEEVPALGTPRGAMFLIAGGPGQGSAHVFDLGRPSSVALNQRLFPGYTLVAYDDRGTGKSGLLDCPGLQAAPPRSGAGAASPPARTSSARRATSTAPSTTSNDLEAVRVVARRRQDRALRHVVRHEARAGLRPGVPAERRAAAARLGAAARSSPIRFGRTSCRAMPATLDRFLRQRLLRLGDAELRRRRRRRGERTRRKADVRAGPAARTGTRRPCTWAASSFLSMVLDSDLNPGLAAELPAVVHARGSADPLPLLRLYSLDSRTTSEAPSI